MLCGRAIVIYRICIKNIYTHSHALTLIENIRSRIHLHKHTHTDTLNTHIRKQAHKLDMNSPSNNK